MVNVNTQVRSSMELPFGEYTLFSVLMSGERKVECGSCSQLFLPVQRFRLQSSAGSRQIQSGSVTAICVCLFHTAVIQEVCQRYGGC